jgi:hypothetical protein
MDMLNLFLIKNSSTVDSSLLEEPSVLQKTRVIVLWNSHIKGCVVTYVLSVAFKTGFGLYLACPNQLKAGKQEISKNILIQSLKRLICKKNNCLSSKFQCRSDGFSFMFQPFLIL